MGVAAVFAPPIESVTRQGAASYTLRFVADVDSEIVAKMSPSGGELSGFWRYRRDSEQAAALGLLAELETEEDESISDRQRAMMTTPDQEARP